MKQFYLARAVLAVVSACALSQASLARGGKEFFSQDYRFDRATSGYEGRAGNYYCSYQRHPNRICATDSRGNEKCQVKGWTLRQYCY